MRPLLATLALVAAVSCQQQEPTAQHDPIVDWVPKDFTTVTNNHSSPLFITDRDGLIVLNSPYLNLNGTVIFRATDSEWATLTNRFKQYLITP